MKPSRIRARNRSGRCYELAARGQVDDPTWTLVHGRMPVEGMPYFVGHAWLSRDGIVYDPVKGKECPAGEYPGVALHRYTAEQAARMMLERGIYGPWEEDVPH